MVWLSLESRQGRPKDEKQSRRKGGVMPKGGKGCKMRGRGGLNRKGEQAPALGYWPLQVGPWKAGKSGHTLAKLNRI